MSALDSEVLVCPAEDSGHCDLIGPYRGPAPIHYCEYDEDHDDAHECACGHRWTNQEED